MCYSAMVKQHLKKLGFEFKARIQLELFEDIYKRRALGEKLRIPRGMDFNFQEDGGVPSFTIKRYVTEYNDQAIQLLEQDLFGQKKRLADAERKLREKPTKTAEKEKGIAGRKIEANERRLAKLRSRTEQPEDSRIFAHDYAPVIVWEHGERVIKPMRYALRPAGFPASFDKEFPGCYNARRDSLKKFWSKQYGHNHAILVISSFFENVKRHEFEHRELAPGEKEENRVIEFKPSGFDRMIIPCIWDRWSEGPDNQDELLSFALITDEPPPEVSQAGHDRCPIFLKESNVDIWLRPDTVSKEELERVLSEKERPIYQSVAVA